MDRAAQLVDWGSGMKVSVGFAYHQHLLSISKLPYVLSGLRRNAGCHHIGSWRGLSGAVR